jgi:DNA-binding transcriptional LysR family regulator
MDKNIRTFLTIARLGSLSQASKSLALTQPTITKRLKNLEDELDCQLFERMARGMDLTAGGTAFLRHAERIELEYIQAQEALEAVKKEKLTHLRIGAGPLFLMRYMLPAIREFALQYPTIKIQLEAGVNPVLLPRLRSRHLDLVFGANEDPLLDDQLEFQPLTPVHTGVAMRADLPIAQKSTVTAEEIVKMPWVLYSDNPIFASVVDNFFHRSGLMPPANVLQTSSFASALDYIQQEPAIMTIPLQLAPVLKSKQIKVMPTTPLIRETIGGVLLRASSAKITEVQHFIEIVRRICKS